MGRAGRREERGSVVVDVIVVAGLVCWMDGEGVLIEVADGMVGW